jgi:hypothetical protein
MEKITAKNTSIRVVKQFSQVVKTSNMNERKRNKQINKIA